MKHVSILIPQGPTSLVNVEGTHQILCEVNTLRVERGNTPLFKIQLVGLSKQSDQPNGLFSIKPDVLVSNLKKTDLVIIPALMDNPQKGIQLNKEFIPWIIDQYNEGAEIVSYCIGSFFLAATGLLNGKQCTTHWRAVNDFRNMFPEANVVNDKIMTEDSGIYTSGGAYSYLNLLLHLVEKYAGREIAILISKTFMIDIDRISQSPFIIFQGQKEHDDEAIKKAQDYIEKNFQNKITVEQLASMYALSRRNLERRFKKATCNTINEYIQRVKIEAAKKNFENSGKNINEVMYAVGYLDTKAFRTTFKKITGLSPIQYRNKYNRELAVA